MPFYLGLDSSTQSLTAIVIAIEGSERRIVFESSLSFDETLPHYGTRHGVLPRTDPAVARSSPLMWAEALDVMMARLAGSGLDLSRLAAVSGSAQQHGSVYLNASWAQAVRALDPRQPVAEQLRSVFARQESPIWMDSSTAEECAEITASVGAADVLAQSYRLACVRAIHRSADPPVLQAVARALSRDRAGASGQLVSRLVVVGQSMHRSIRATHPA